MGVRTGPGTEGGASLHIWRATSLDCPLLSVPAQVLEAAPVSHEQAGRRPDRLEKPRES